MFGEFEFDDRVLNAAVFGVLLAAFFAAGVTFSEFTAEKKVPISAPDNTDSASNITVVTEQEAEQRGKQFIMAQVPPFVTNVSTVSINKDERLGEGFFYNWTAALTVEPNSFGQWATNTTRQRVVNFYISSNGKYVFTSPPQSTDVQRQPTVRTP